MLDNMKYWVVIGGVVLFCLVVWLLSIVDILGVGLVGGVVLVFFGVCWVMFSVDIVYLGIWKFVFIRIV